MNNKDFESKEVLFTPMNERLLIVSLGVLFSGLAHGATSNGTGEDCRIQSIGDGTSVQQELICTPLSNQSTEATPGNAPNTHKQSDNNATGRHEDTQSLQNTIDDNRPSGPKTIEIQSNEPDESGTKAIDTTTDNASKHVTDDSTTSDTSTSGDSNSDESTTNSSKMNAAAGEGTTSDNSKRDAAPNGGTSTDNSENGGAAADGAASEGSDNETPDNAENGASTHDASTADPATGDPINNLATDGSAINTPAKNPDTAVFNLDKATAETEESETPDASDRDLFTLGAASHKTSDKYHAHTYSLAYHNRRREWFWPWQEAQDKNGLDWGLNVDRTEGHVQSTDLKALEVKGALGSYVGQSTYLQGQVGRHVLNTDQGDRTITPHKVTAMFGLDKKFSVQLENSRDFIYTSGSVTGGITKQLAATNNIGSFNWRPQPRIRIEGQGGYSEYDQDNKARQASLNALYGVSPDWPWIWAGVGVDALNYHRNVPDYWSPNRFYAYGLRLDSSFPIYDRLSGSLSGSLNRQYEKQLKVESYSTGTGYDLSAGLQYRLYGQVHARFTISKSKSLQNGSAWRSDDVFFSLNMPLF